MSDFMRKRGRLAIETSLDDLVDEQESYISRKHKNTGSRSKEQKTDDEIDPLDAFMLDFEKEASKNTVSNRLDKNIDENSGSDSDEVSSSNQKHSNSGNTSTNKTIKRLNQLSKKEKTYAPFRKDFYVEVPELACLTKEEVKELRENLENISVVGKSCPKPAKCWAHCGLSKKIMEVLKKNKYHSPTPIQAQAIPAIMSGRDVIGIAKTGCGKTLSFLLPMFRHIRDQPKLQRGDGPIALVITPTRELATQICDDASKFTCVLGLRAVSIFGGPNISEQIALLRKTPEIVVCTPGRMIEIITLNGGKVTNLDRCTFLVLDEADRLFDMGFEKQITSIINLIRPDRQTVLFSATFPKIMEAHARRILQKPIEILVGGRSIVCKDVHQTVEIIEEHEKLRRLIQILKEHVKDESSAIIFVGRQEKADRLLGNLMQSYDSQCLVLHGGIDKDDRISTFASFKGGQTKVLVATSIAARGLDVKNCILVVNYDCPDHYEDYVHRCGRTGRAGNKGFAFTFITPEQAQYANNLIKALTSSEVEVPPELQKLWDDYKDEQERLGKKVWYSSGFSGKGYQFDEAEAKLQSERKKFQKKSLGLQNSDDEDNAANSDDEAPQTVTQMKQSESTTASNNQTLEVNQGKESQSNIQNQVQAAISAMSLLPPQLVSKVELIKKKVSLWFEVRQLPGIPTNSVSKLMSERYTEAKLSAKLAAQANVNTVRQNAQIKASTGSLPAPNINPSTAQIVAQPQTQVSVPIATPETTEPIEAVAIGERFEIELEINNCEYTVRRRLTSKDTLNKVIEEHEVGITVRGTFCEIGKTTNERKLYLALEGKTKISVERAYMDLQRLIKDEEARLKMTPMARMGKFKIL